MTMSLGRIEPAGTRTRDPVIKSHMLYQLSYRLDRPAIVHDIRQKRNGLHLALSPFGLKTGALLPCLAFSLTYAAL